MRYILNIETSTKNCSVSLAADGKCISLIEKAEEGYPHAEKLHVYISQVLSQSGISVKDLSAVAVSKGPGSYTGLRIGVSSAKGYCFALDIPLVSLNTLAILAHQIGNVEGVIVPMLDARRMEVYCAEFENGSAKSDVRAQILSDNLYSDAPAPVHILGDCQEKIATVLRGDKFVFHPEAVHPSAREMAELADEKYRAADFEDVAYFEPFYLKDFMPGVK